MRVAEEKAAWQAVLPDRFRRAAARALLALMLLMVGNAVVGMAWW